MVTSAELHAYTARRPFKPFWMKLVSGETVHVREPNRAVVMPAQLVYTGEGRSTRWIRLKEIQEHGPLASTSGHADADRETPR